MQTKEEVIDKLNYCFANIVTIRKQVNGLIDKGIIIPAIADLILNPTSQIDNELSVVHDWIQELDLDID